MTTLTSNIQCILAADPADLDQVYRLRYRCYRRKGSIPARAEESFSDAFDQKPNSFSFLLRSSSNHEPMATVRINAAIQSRGWTDCPVQNVYGDHPVFQQIARESFVEANRLCFAEQARRDAFVGLVGHMAATADVFGAEWLVACPRVEHAHVYQKMFGFKPLAEPRRYFGVSFDTQLLGIRHSDLEVYVRNSRPLFAAWSSAREYLLATLAHGHFQFA